MQQQAVKTYREKVSLYVPKAKDIADQGVELANEVIDDVSESFNDPDSFNNLKKPWVISTLTLSLVTTMMANGY